MGHITNVFFSSSYLSYNIFEILKKSFSLQRAWTTVDTHNCRLILEMPFWKTKKRTKKNQKELKRAKTSKTLGVETVKTKT